MIHGQANNYQLRGHQKRLGMLLKGQMLQPDKMDSQVPMSQVLDTHPVGRQLFMVQTLELIEAVDAVENLIRNPRSLENPRNQESQEDTDVKSLANPPGTYR